jgi:ribosome maturation factor RimP
LANVRNPQREREPDRKPARKKGTSGRQKAGKSAWPAERPKGRHDPAENARLEERVRSLAEPVLGRYDAELVELAVRRGRTQLVRIVVDRAGGVDLDTCARVSQELSRMLDADDPIAGRYTLEVSSPGLGRPLRTAEDYRRVIGRRVRIVLEHGQHEGTLEEVGEDRVRVATDRGPVKIPIADVASAKELLPW